MSDLSDKFSYMNEGELIELKHSCQLCLREHKDNKCEFYPDGIPDEILDFKKQCKYEVDSSDAAFDRAVSDNMSAYFKNDPEVVQRYFDEGIDYYQHDNSYWSRHGSREAEIYANSFSMMAQDNKASCEFMERYFQNTWKQFKKML